MLIFHLEKPKRNARGRYPAVLKRRNLKIEKIVENNHIINEAPQPMPDINSQEQIGIRCKKSEQVKTYLYQRSYYYIVQIDNQMQVLEMRLKFVVQWIIQKKQAIATLVTNHLPIYRAIKQFIEAYINHMEEIVIIVEKIMKDLHSTLTHGSNQTLYDLFDLIRQKELVGVQQWADKLTILEAKYNKENSQAKQFPDIFKDIDNNIEYYQQLRVKLRLAITKSSQREQKINKYTPQREMPKEMKYTETQRNRNTFKTYAEHTDRQPRKTDMYAGLYDKQYSGKKDNKAQELIRQNGKIKKSPRHNTSPSQFSPYKLVNPKYQSTKENVPNPQNKYETATKLTELNYTYSHQKKIDGLLTRHQRYQDYKKQLYAEMDKQIQMQRITPKYTAEKYLYKTPPKIWNKEEQSAAYTDRNDKSLDEQKNYESEGLKYQYWSDNYNKLPGKNNEEDQPTSRKAGNNKKYQYLFDDDEDRNQQIAKAKSPKTEIFHQRNLFNKYGEKEQKNRQLVTKDQDSFQQDRLGPELEVEMPTIFGGGNNNIEQLLYNSLMSSKKWDQEQDKLSVDSSELFHEKSEQDSLDDPSDRIRQTGKFKEIHYTDEDEKEDYPEKRSNPVSKFNYDAPLTIQKQISSESKDLNMSFGRN